ncbi:MAG: diguanylate cyclase [Deltaproteobacteria bacterium]|nr:diguanylate cyclase [Deltaproteobacteria bacterium]
MEKPAILIVEDANVFSRLLEKSATDLGAEPLIAKTLKQGLALREQAGARIVAALVDLHLPDGTGQEVLEALVCQDYATMVFSGSDNTTLRESAWRLGVLDYIVKDQLASLRYLQAVLGRVLRNRGSLAVVADDSSTARKQVTDLLTRLGLQVLGAKDGAQALELVRTTERVRLVVCDYHMPNLDGFALVRELRKQQRYNNLPIIGLSSTDDPSVSTRLIKAGADDFLPKPFAPEEFFCRVGRALDMAHLVEGLEQAATRDALTGLNNRRQFFTLANQLWANYRREQLDLAFAMIDLDHFKQVNDQHGHGVGDSVLREVAQVITRNIRSTDILARIGGEEFCLLAVNTGAADSRRAYFERLRSAIAQVAIALDDGACLRPSASIGACSAEGHDSVEAALKRADELLYRAKAEGRNRVVIA